MSKIIQISCFLSLLLIIWFQTNAFVEWTRYFNIGWLFWVDDFEEKKKTNRFLSYIDYLKMEFPESFFVKLITCPICISVWLSILSGFYIGFMNAGVTNILVLGIYYGVCKIKN